MPLSGSVNITDKPLYKFRGLLIDLGRRYMSVHLLKSIIDGMSYSKVCSDVIVAGVVTS